MILIMDSIPWPRVPGSVLPLAMFLMILTKNPVEKSTGLLRNDLIIYDMNFAILDSGPLLMTAIRFSLWGYLGVWDKEYNTEMVWHHP